MLRVHFLTMRRVLFTVLALLFLTLQHQVLVHPLEHLGSQLSRQHGTSLAPTQADPVCDECAMLAAGGTALDGAPDHLQHVPPAIVHVAYVSDARISDDTAWFQSRAPPFAL